MATATFTKWMVGEGPGMAGFVGGDVGDGTFAGQVLDLTAGSPVKGEYTEIKCDHDGTTTDCWQGTVEIDG